MLKISIHPLRKLIKESRKKFFIYNMSSVWITTKQTKLDSQKFV